MQRLSLWVLSIALFCTALIASARASDHADPLHLTDPGSNITDLFLFPKGDQYILILNVQKSVVGPTLGLTMYGIVSLSSRIVEPLIALSIAYVAIENILTPRLTPWRPAVVFGFGLLHGMGFAGVLTELRLPRAEIIPALISFNVGIELAQLTVIGVAFFAVAAWFRDRWWYRPRFVVPASALIAAIGLFWTVQRVFWPEA